MSFIHRPEDIKLNDQDDPEAIIGNLPGWALRWGMTALLLAFGLVLALSAFIRYPDIVEARAVLTTENPPLRIKAATSGEIERLLVKNGQLAQAGEVLAILKNAALPEDIAQLEPFLEKIEAAEPATLLAVAPPSGLRLGELQGDFSKLREQLSDLQFFGKQETNFLKINNLRQQIVGILKINGSLESQIRLLETETSLTRKNYERDSFLFFDKASLSRLEMEQSHSAFLRKKRELEALRSGLSQNDLSARQLEAQILDLQQFQSGNINDRLLAFRQTTSALQGKIAEWKQAWLVLAPIAGTVDLSPSRSEHQFVREGEEILTIVPVKEAGKLACRAILPTTGIGKVTPGLVARLRLDAFPYQQFGSLEGRVGNIALAPVEAGYEIEILLGDSLKTNFGKVIPFRQELQGTLRIVAEKRSLLNRMLPFFTRD